MAAGNAKPDSWLLELSGTIYNSFRQRTAYLDSLKEGLFDQQVKQTTTICFIVMCHLEIWPCCGWGLKSQLTHRGIVLVIM